jgi:hypothetical protein
VPGVEGGGGVPEFVASPADRLLHRLEHLADALELLRRVLFALIARRYERGSIIVTSNRGFEAWGEILGDAMVAAALIDRLVHHATMVALKGKSYRLRERAANSATPRQRPRPQTLS